MIPRTVLYVIPDLRVGGAELQVVQLAEGIASHGWRPAIATLFPGGELAERVRRARIPLHPLCAEMCYRKTDPRFYVDAASTINRLRRVIRQEKAAVVHGFLFWPSIYAALGRQVSRAQVCVTSRRSMGVTKAGRPSYQWIENLANMLTAAVTGNSLEVHEEILRTERVRRSHVGVIYNGVDLSFFSRCPSLDLRAEFPGLADAEVIVGGVANLRTRKAFCDFVAALAIARRSCPGLKGIIVGGERDVTREQLMARASELGIADALVVVANPPDVRPYFGGFDFFCQSSLTEGFPNVVLEAMAAGRAVVATDVGGTREAVSDGENGRLVPAGQPEALARVMVELASDPEKRLAWGRAGREVAERRFSLEAMRAAHARLYDSLINTGHLPAMANPPIIEAVKE
jgi:glycosyltransferase involved in cell wall biosynthesis